MAVETTVKHVEVGRGLLGNSVLNCRVALFSLSIPYADWQPAYQLTHSTNDWFVACLSAAATHPCRPRYAACHGACAVE